MVLIKNIYNHFMHDSLYRNSIYLMASTAIMSFFGFFFWIFVARIFSVEHVGLATTLISVMTLLSTISQLGLNNTLIRFLPKSGNKNYFINSSFNLSIIASVLSSIAFIVGLNIFSPKLVFLRDHWYTIIIFILLVCTTTLGSIIESVFIFYRSSNYVLIKNGVISLAKLTFPILLVTFGALGIFYSVGFATILGVTISLLILTIIFKYRYALNIKESLVNQRFKYSFNNYLAGLANLMPGLVLPIIITNRSTVEMSAYFYIALMITNLLYIIPIATTQSLFAEGSHNERDVNNYTKLAIKIILLLLTPSLLLLVLLGDNILLAFGKNYSLEGFFLLQILGFSSIIISANYIMGTILKIRNMLKGLIIGNIIGSLTIIILSYLLVPKGLYWVGVSWIIGQIIIMFVYIVLLRVNYKKLNTTY